MKTSYFAKYKGKHGVSIAKGTPSWFKGKTCENLFPESWEMINNKKNEESFIKKYNEALSKLNAKEIYDELGDDAVLLCWEKSGEFCHRHLVAEWFRKQLGIDIEEIK